MVCPTYFSCHFKQKSAHFYRWITTSPEKKKTGWDGRCKKDLHVQPAFAGQSTCSYAQAIVPPDVHLLGHNPSSRPSPWDGNTSVKTSLTTTFSSLNWFFVTPNSRHACLQKCVIAMCSPNSRDMIQLCLTALHLHRLRQGFLKRLPFCYQNISFIFNCR